MVEMYLYPEMEVLWAQAEQGKGPDQQPLQANMEAVAAAQKLLSDTHVTEKYALQHQVSWYPLPLTILVVKAVLVLGFLPKQSVLVLCLTVLLHLGKFNRIKMQYSSKKGLGTMLQPKRMLPTVSCRHAS